MVLLAVELDEGGAEVRAHVGHHLFAALEDVCRQCPAPVLGDKDQMGVQVGDLATASTDSGVWYPPG